MGTNIVKGKAYEIEFRNVSFEYPSRPGMTVLSDFNLGIEKGRTVALVGGSGCGKSTCISLLSRFYDPLNGSVRIQNADISTVNLSELRSKVAMVGQEPRLFDYTIKENILLGNPMATMEEVVAACEASNARGFIEKLPLKYDTACSETTQVSGVCADELAPSQIAHDPLLALLPPRSHPSSQAARSSVLPLRVL